VGLRSLFGMAMMKCPECGHAISTYAKTCPSCGTGIVEKTTAFDWFYYILITVVAVVIFVKCA